MVNGNLTDWYQLPNSTSITGLGTFIQSMNTYVNGWLGYGFLFIIFLTTFGLSMVSGSRKALLASSFITFLFSIYLMRMEMINPVITLVLIIMVIIGALGSRSEGSY